MQGQPLKKLLLSIAVTACFSTGLNAEENLGPKYSKDEQGQVFVNDVTLQVDAIKANLRTLYLQVEGLEQLLAERQTAIDYINKENEQRYFTVMPGSFKEQLAKFADHLGVQTIRWSGVPSCTDWELDSSYKIDMQDTTGAIDEFLDGMALSYQYFERDRSLNLTSLVTLEECPNAK